jgi:hypothetical protein
MGLLASLEYPEFVSEDAYDRYPLFTSQKAAASVLATAVSPTNGNRAGSRLSRRNPFIITATQGRGSR